MEAIRNFFFGPREYQRAPEAPDKKDDDYGLYLVEEIHALFEKSLPPYTSANDSLYTQKISDVAYAFRKFSLENCTHVHHLIVEIFDHIHTQKHLNNLRSGLERAAQDSKTDVRKRAIYSLRACFPHLYPTEETPMRSRRKKKDRAEANPADSECLRGKDKLEGSAGPERAHKGVEGQMRFIDKAAASEIQGIKE